MRFGDRARSGHRGSRLWHLGRLHQVCQPGCIRQGDAIEAECHSRAARALLALPGTRGGAVSSTSRVMTIANTRPENASTRSVSA